MRSCWIHGSETWPMTERKLDISEAHVLRWMCGLKIKRKDKKHGDERIVGQSVWSKLTAKFKCSCSNDEYYVATLIIIS